MDSIAAQKAGMSYGKWKALHPHTGVEETAVVQGPKRLCKICGQEIPEGYTGKLYCGIECSYEGKKASARRCFAKKKERMMADGKV
jgi:hypothetical protein